MKKLEKDYLDLKQKYDKDHLAISLLISMFPRGGVKELLSDAETMHGFICAVNLLVRSYLGYITTFESSQKELDKISVIAKEFFSNLPSKEDAFIEKFVAMDMDELEKICLKKLKKINKKSDG